MARKSISLGKLLKLFGAAQNQLTTDLRAELRRERDRELKSGDGARDFYVPFWSDAKIHVIGSADLRVRTKVRVEESVQRKNLYPQLSAGFLKWFDGVKRHTNEAVGWKEANFHNHIEIDGLDLEVKVDNLLSLQIGSDRYEIVYPYFAKLPDLSNKWARVGLWAMTEAFPNESLVDMEILDVLRGRGFKGSRISLRGDEEYLFKERYEYVLNEWDKLRPYYGLD